MDNQIHNIIVSFIWGIADDCLRDVFAEQIKDITYSCYEINTQNLIQFSDSLAA